MLISFPYGRGQLSADLPDHRIEGILMSGIEQFQPDLSEIALIEHALAHPIGSKPLSELAKGKNASF